MRVHSSKIEDVFEIADRGCIVVPGLMLGDDTHVRIGDPVTLRRPDGTEFETTVAGIEMIGTPDRNALPVLLPKTIRKHHIPIGTQIDITETRPRDNDPDVSMMAIGDSVSVIANHRNKTARRGTIDSIIWHHKNQLWHYYIIDDSGTKISKRYTSYDLTKCDAGNGT